MPYLLRCPKCGQTQKYQPRKGTLWGKTKKCVYCGFNMTAHKYVQKRVP